MDLELPRFNTVEVSGPMQMRPATERPVQFRLHLIGKKIILITRPERDAIVQAIQDERNKFIELREGVININQITLIDKVYV